MGINKNALILMVEDEEDHGRLIIKALKDHGHLLNDIEWRKNGQDALDFLFQKGTYANHQLGKPALILLDVKLPMKDGFEVLQEIKANEELKTIPVVMLTTTGDSDDIERALALGANDYIVKPLRFSDFVEKVGKLGNYWFFTSDTTSIRH